MAYCEEITTAAIKVGSVILTAERPMRHDDLSIWKCNNRLNLGDGSILYYGFMTNKGRFVGRNEARMIALDANQCNVTDDLNNLYTEDLW